MIKQITMPTMIKTHSIDAQLVHAGVPEHVERHEKRVQTLRESVTAAEAELDEALNDGYKLFDKYTVETPLSVGVVFILHKPPSDPYVTHGDPYAAFTRKDVSPDE